VSLFGVIAKSSVVDACFESEDIFDEVHDLVETPLELSHDVFMHEESPSLGCNNVLPNPLDHSHVSPIGSLPSPSPKCFIETPIENLMIFGANVDLGYEDKIFNVLSENVDNFFS